jgi:DNA primase
MDTRDVEAAKAVQLSDIVGQSVALKRRGHDLVGLCPFHNERTPSFYVTDKGFFHCFGCGANGDAIDWVMQNDGCSFSAAVEKLLGREVDLPKRDRVQAQFPVLSEREDDARRIAHAHNVWMKREPVIGTLAHTYLRHVRRINVPLRDQLGYVAECYDGQTERNYPALVGAIQSPAGAVTGIQRVWLDTATGDAIRIEGKRHKTSLGVLGHGAVRLAPAWGDMLGIAGSIEDGLSAMQLFSIPVWASCGEARMGSVDVPDHIKRVVLFGDSDASGEKLSALAASKLGSRRRDLDIVIQQPVGHKDWNACLGG